MLQTRNVIHSEAFEEQYGIYRFRSLKDPVKDAQDLLRMSNLHQISVNLCKL